jgi:competence protein ComEC
MLEVHFLDVGQADCILVQQGADAMLIDAGNNADGPDVVTYLHDHGVNRLDTVIGTHPHEDHIGGLDLVLLSFPVDTLIMPKVAHTTKTFEDVLDAIKAKGLRVTAPVTGQRFRVGDAQCTVLAPRSAHYDDLNDYSVVVRVTFGDTAFLFAGDAEAESENEMLQGGLPLSADVLKVGHHGSATSSTAAFLKAVSPSAAVISVGGDNDYGHPAPATLGRLEDVGARVYRADLTGTIVVHSDGRTVRVEP